jgi:hypothetical protein
MTDYYPNEWVAIRGTTKDPADGVVVKIFGGWWGGFATGDTWRVNSGVKSVEVADDGHLMFHGHTGSVYHCHPDSYGTNGWRAMQLEGLLAKAEADGNPWEILPETTDWRSLVGQDA